MCYSNIVSLDIISVPIIYLDFTQRMSVIWVKYEQDTKMKEEKQGKIRKILH